MAIFKRKKITASSAIQLVASCEAEFEAAKEALRDAQTKLGEAALAAAESPADAEIKNALAAARRAVEAAANRAENAEFAIRAAKIQHAAAIEQEQSQKEIASWAKIKEEFAPKILEVAKRIEESQAKAAGDLHTLVRLANDAAALVPRTDGTSIQDSVISEQAILGYFRLELRRTGGPLFSWARAFFDDERTIPKFSSNIEQGVAWLMKMAPKTNGH